MEGMTIKQYNIKKFFNGLDSYKKALESGTKEEIIHTSLAIQFLKGGVPKRFHSLVNKAFKETKRTTPL